MDAQEIALLEDYGYTVPRTMDELRAALERLGYSVCEADSFFYTNSSNPGTAYKAWSLAIRETDTGKSFAHFEGRRDGRFHALQWMRRNTPSIMHNGRVIEF